MMDEKFSGKWLSVRGIEDFACRCWKIMSNVDSMFEHHEALNIVDIGCGFGNNMNIMLPILKPRQHWHLVDHDLKLLEAAENWNSSRILNTDHELSIHHQDLSEGFGFLNEGIHMVTASAFLDLVSGTWLTSFVNALNSNSIVFYGALTVCEPMVILPEHPSDSKVLDAFKSHQQTDKGFGPALGPNASRFAREKFQEAGYDVRVSEYNWGMQILNERYRNDLHAMFLEGIVVAVNETGLVSRKETDRWLSDRLCSINEGKCEVRVAYEDLLATPIR